MVQIRYEENKAIVQLERDLVAATVPELKNQLKELVDQGAQVAIDLERVDMVDSTGIGLLMATHNSLQKNENTLELLNISEEIRSLFKTMRLDKRFQMAS